VASNLEKNALQDVASLPAFANARSIIGTAENIVSGLNNIKNDMSSGDPLKINQHRDFLSKSFGDAGTPGQLQVAAKALEDLASHDWDNEEMPSTSSADTAKTTSISTTASTENAQPSSPSSSISSGTTFAPSPTSAQASEVSLLSTTSSATLVSSFVDLSTSTISQSSTSSSSSASCSQNTARPGGIGARAAVYDVCPAPQRAEYCFLTKRGTSRAQFDDLIKSLPDQGNGLQDTSYESTLQLQMYITQLTVEEAAQIRRLDFIEFVGRNDLPEPFPYEARAARPRKKRDDIPTAGDPHFLERTNSADHLRLVTQVPKQNSDGVYIMPDRYTFDATLASGSTVYVVDTGFNSAHAVSFTYVTLLFPRLLTN
jgi:hypothetical protein